MNELIYILLSILGFLSIFNLYLYKRNRDRINILEQVIKTLAKKPDKNIYRIRKRYIVFTILSNNKKYSRREIEKSIREKLREIFGTEALVKADPQLIYYEPNINRGVIRTTHIYKEHVIATLGLVREINGTKCLIIPLKTTGTLKKAKKILYRLRKELQK